MFDTRPSETGESLREIPLERLEHEITQLAAHVNAGMCRWLELVAEFDRREAWSKWTGCRSSAEWVAWRCALDPRAAREHVRVARSLAELPRIHRAFREGWLSYSKARALSRVADAGTEQDLLELAKHATAAQLERVCSAMRRVSTREANEVHADRSLTWFWEDDGSLSVHGSLPPEDGATLLAALEAARARIRGGAEGGDGGSAEPREPLRATNADALVAVAESSLGAAEPGQAVAEVVVHVDAATLTGEGSRAPSQARSHLEHGPALAPETARRLGCDAAIVSSIERDGEPLSIGRRKRAVPSAIRRALAARDGTCRFPGCESRFHLDSHHIRHWADGGETSLENLVRLCRRHHRLLHEGGFSVQRVSDEEFRFRDSRGALIPESPRLPAGELVRIVPEDVVPEPPLPGSGERLDLDLTLAGLCRAA